MKLLQLVEMQCTICFRIVRSRKRAYGIHVFSFSLQKGMEDLMEEELNDEKMLVDDEPNQSDDVISGSSTLCNNFLGNQY